MSQCGQRLVGFAALLTNLQPNSGSRRRLAGAAGILYFLKSETGLDITEQPTQLNVAFNQTRDISKPYIEEDVTTVMMLGKNGHNQQEVVENHTESRFTHQFPQLRAPMNQL